MDKEVRPYTKEEAQKAVLRNIANTTKYWLKESRAKTTEAKLTGLAFSILAMIDGSAIGLPAMDIVLRPHISDEDFHRSRGEKWWQDGMAINDEVHLHDMWHEIYEEVKKEDD